jgi:hypothetical protein
VAGLVAGTEGERRTGIGAAADSLIAARHELGVHAGQADFRGHDQQHEQDVEQRRADQRHGRRPAPAHELVQ